MGSTRVCVGGEVAEGTSFLEFSSGGRRGDRWAGCGSASARARFKLRKSNSKKRHDSRSET